MEYPTEQHSHGPQPMRPQCLLTPRWQETALLTASAGQQSSVGITWEFERLLEFCSHISEGDSAA